MEGMKFFADIYGNRPNPFLAHNPVYGLCLLIFIGAAALVFWAMGRKK